MIKSLFLTFILLSACQESKGDVLIIKNPKYDEQSNIPANRLGADLGEIRWDYTPSGALLLEFTPSHPVPREVSHYIITVDGKQIRYGLSTKWIHLEWVPESISVQTVLFSDER